MPIRVITWNLYYGNCATQPQFNGAATSAVERLNHIANYANGQNVDVVFLQEHPGATSGQVDGNGRLLGANTHGYNYTVFQEMPGALAPRVSLHIRAYAILTRPGIVLGPMQYFNQNDFRQYPGGPYMRAPVLTPIGNGHTNYNFLQWHNQVGNDAATGMDILTGLLAANLPANTVIVGDLNQTSNQIDNYAFYNNWIDVVNNNNQNGVDHVLSSFQANPAFNLDFMSDPYHFPIDCVLL